MTTKSVSHHLWMDLPLVTYAFYALGIAHAEITNLADQRLDLLPTAVFPMLVPWLIYALRWKDLERTGRIAALILSIGTPALIILNTLGNPRVVLDNHMLRQIYEGVAIVRVGSQPGVAVGFDPQQGRLGGEGLGEEHAGEIVDFKWVHEGDGIDLSFGQAQTQAILSDETSFLGQH